MSVVHGDGRYGQLFKQQPSPKPIIKLSHCQIITFFNPVRGNQLDPRTQNFD